MQKIKNLNNKINKVIIIGDLKNIKIENKIQIKKNKI